MSTANLAISCMKKNHPIDGLLINIVIEGDLLLHGHGEVLILS
jgi:hypothetical protein